MARTNKSRRQAQVREAKRLKPMVEAYILERGGRRQSWEKGEWYDFQMPTPFGVMLVSVHDEDTSIYCRFEDVELAASRLGRHSVNVYSGKWNHHPPMDWKAEEVLESWTRRVETLPAPAVVAS